MTNLDIYTVDLQTGEDYFHPDWGKTSLLNNLFIAVYGTRFATCSLGYQSHVGLLDFGVAACGNRGLNDKTEGRQH